MLWLDRVDGGPGEVFRGGIGNVGRSLVSVQVSLLPAEDQGGQYSNGPQAAG